MAMQKNSSEYNEQLHVVIVGHIDHGKSTLIGRLLYDTGSLPGEKIEEIKAFSHAQGKAMEFAYVMDHLEEERHRGITIDTAQTFFKTDKRRYVIIDAPGHREFLKNMFTGSVQAEAAMLLIDAEEGIQEQTRRHCHILSLIGIKQIVVLVNKMDLIGYSKARFDEISTAATRILSRLSLEPTYIIPLSALLGENVASGSKQISWYSGPTVLTALDSFEVQQIEERELRLPVQDVYHLDGREIAVGRIEAGRLKKKQHVLILPDQKRAVVVSIEKYLENGLHTAFTGECIGFCLDTPVHRGHVLVSEAHKKSPSPRITETIHGNLFWMSEEPCHKGDAITFKCVTQEVQGRIEKIYKRYDPAEVEVVQVDASEIRTAEIAEVSIALKKPVVVDLFDTIPEMGRFVLEREGHPLAGGIVL